MNNVLITTYPEAFLNRGGGEIELLDILHNLRLLGVKADVYGPTSQPLARYDVVLHYSVARSGLEFVRQVRAAGKRLVLMPSTWWVGVPADSEIDNTKEFFELADKIVFKSRAELENVAQFVHVDESKAALCRWGVDCCFAEHVDADLFRKTYQLDEYVLNLGIIDERKNQLSAIRALQGLGLPLVLVGDYRDPRYYEACVRSASRHDKFVPHLPPKSQMLRSAIAGCKAFIEVSLEPCGFSALEAALARVPLVLSSGAWTSEHFENAAQFVDPYSSESIRAGVTAATSNGPVEKAYQLVHNNNLMPQALERLSATLRELL